MIRITNQRVGAVALVLALSFSGVISGVIWGADSAFAVDSPSKQHPVAHPRPEPGPNKPGAGRKPVAPRPGLSGPTEVALEPRLSDKDKAAVEAYKVFKKNYDATALAGKSTKQDYEAEISSYKAASVSYAKAKRMIGQTFSATLKAARADYIQTISGEVTVEQQLVAKKKFKEARAAATVSRNLAIQALGAPPAKPAILKKSKSNRP